MRPLWRDLILKVWGGDPLECPCCKGTMKPVRTILRREEIEKRRRLVGVLDGGEAEARRVSPPAGRANQTMEPIEPPWQAVKEWIADAPLWPCRLQGPPPDLVFFIRRLNAAGAFRTTSQI